MLISKKIDAEIPSYLEPWYVSVQIEDAHSTKLSLTEYI